MYVFIAASAAAVTAAATAIVKTKRTFIRLKILKLRKWSNKSLLTEVKKIIHSIFIIQRLQSGDINTIIFT